MPPKKGGLAKAPAGKKGKAAAPKEGGRAVGHPFTVPAYGNLRLQLHVSVCHSAVRCEKSVPHSSRHSSRRVPAALLCFTGRKLALARLH